LQGGIVLNEQILQACKELVDDAKKGCADLVFKEVASEKMQERIPFELQQKLMARE